MRDGGRRPAGFEIDLEAEVILDSLGRRVDQASVDWALVESGGAAHDCVEPGARGG